MNKEPIYHSNIFWHFCGRDKTEEEAFGILCNILKDKNLRRNLTQNSDPFEEPITDCNGNDTLTWQIQYICFADIPFAFLNNHIATYGNVGLGFKREFIIEKGGQPVLYVPFVDDNGIQKAYPSSISSIIERWGKEWATITQKYQLNSPEDRDLGWKIQFLRKYIKQFSFKDEYCTYYEREWRIINHLEFEEKDVTVVIFPKRFSKEFSNLYPNISYTVSELILT